MNIEKPTVLQEAALAVPYDLDVALLGGRGGGKSLALVFMIYSYACAFPGTRQLYLRQSYPALHDFIMASIQVFPLLDPGAKFNKAALHWEFSNGSACTLAAYGDLDAYRKFQGSSIAAVYFDETQQYGPNEGRERVDLLCSNLRATNADTRAVFAANPGDVGFYWLKKRFVEPSPGNGVPFISETGRETVTLFSTYLDNPHLNHTEYLRNLEAATTHDHTLREQWITGDWTIGSNLFFSDVMSYKNKVDWYSNSPWAERGDWRLFVALDWGTAAPAVALLMAQARDTTRGPDMETYKRNDLVVMAECSTALTNDLARGDRSSVSEFCDRLKDYCSTWYKTPRRGCGDDAIFAEHGHEKGSLGAEFQRNGFEIAPAGKGRRVDGWAVTKERLANAEVNGSREKPAIYINAYCAPQLWETLQTLAPDRRNPEDIADGQVDHHADSLRYSAVFKLPSPASVTGFYR